MTRSAEIDILRFPAPAGESAVPTHSGNVSNQGSPPSHEGTMLQGNRPCERNLGRFDDGLHRRRALHLAAARPLTAHGVAVNCPQPRIAPAVFHGRGDFNFIFRTSWDRLIRQSNQISARSRALLADALLAVERAKSK